MEFLRFRRLTESGVGRSQEIAHDLLRAEHRGLVVTSYSPCSVSSGGSTSAPALCPSCSTAMRSLLASLWDPTAFARMHSASSHRSACVDVASRPSSFWATPRNPSTAHSCAISPTPSPGSTESKQAKPMSRLPPNTPSQRDRVRKAIRYAFLAPDIVRAHCRRPPARWADLELPLASSASRRLGETASARQNAVSLPAPTS